MFVALVVSQAYVLRDMVAVVQQPAATTPELVERSVVLIVVIGFFNLSYAFNEFKVIWPWVPKIPKALNTLWGETREALFGPATLISQWQ